MKPLQVYLAALRSPGGPLSADKAPGARRRPFTAGRDTAPSGVPARHGRVGGEGIRLRCAPCSSAAPNLVDKGSFFAGRLTPSFFVASVVAPPESPDFGTTPQKTGETLGH